MKEKECKHNYVQLTARSGKKTISTRLWTCLECGVLKVGTRTIYISRDRINMGDGVIDNAKSVSAEGPGGDRGFFGQVRYS